VVEEETKPKMEMGIIRVGKRNLLEKIQERMERDSVLVVLGSIVDRTLRHYILVIHMVWMLCELDVPLKTLRKILLLWKKLTTINISELSEIEKAAILIASYWFLIWSAINIINLLYLSFH